MLAYLIWSGRWARAPLPSSGVDGLITNLLWLASLAPLVLTALSIGRQHIAARRMGYSIIVGLREILRSAAGLKMSASTAAQFDRAPHDNPLTAAAIGVAVGLGMPLFFASALPFLRTPLALVWLAGTGVLVGASIYARQRAMAYLRDDPGRWIMFRQYRLLNPARYEEPGRRFVRVQVAVAVLLPVWWIGGGFLLMSR